MGTADRERLSNHEAARFGAADRRVAEMARSLRRIQGLGELARSLRELRAALEIHFASEEAPDAFFDMITDRAAVHVARVQQFRHEHVTFVREIDFILDRIRACLAGPVTEIMRQAGSLADRLEEHEMSESDLLGEAMSTDVGVGDDG